MAAAIVSNVWHAADAQQPTIQPLDEIEEPDADGPDPEQSAVASDRAGRSRQRGALPVDMRRGTRFARDRGLPQDIASCSR